MTVSAIMKRNPAVLAIAGEDDGLNQVAATLADPDTSAVVVLTAGGDLAGIISEQDMVHALAAQGPAFSELKARDVMTREVVTCTPRETEMTVLARMTERQIRHMPVVDKGRVVAMITLPQAVKYRLWKIGRLVEQEPGAEERAEVLGHHAKKLPSDTRRNQMIEVARQLIIDQGMGAFTVRNVAKAAGLSPGMITVVFGGIDGLLHAVFDSVMFELPETTGREATNLTVAIINLRFVVKRYFDPQYFSRASLLVWLPLFETMLRDEAFRVKIHARDEEYVAQFAVHVGKVIDFRGGEEDPVTVARNLMSFMDGLWLRWCHSNRTDTKAEQAAALDYLESKVGSLAIDGI